MVDKVSSGFERMIKNNPISRLFELLTFIKVRKKDTRFPIVLWKVLLAYSLLVALLIIICFYFIDNPYLKLHQEGALPSHFIFEYVTKIGKSNWVLILTGIFILGLGIKTGNQYKGNLHAVWHRVFFTCWFIFYSIAASGIVTIFLKYCFGRSRPSSISGDNAILFSPFEGGYYFASFPSGHSTTVGALAMILILFFPRHKLAFILLAIFASSTRFIVGAHFPSDVIMGLFIGAAFTWVYARSMAYHRLLFGFAENGTLRLRGEGRGHYHKIGTMFFK
ncbi:MAG: phosphatase PAP2 family protein [Nitratireductor sp.]